MKLDSGGPVGRSHGMASASPQPHRPSLLAHTCYGWDMAASQPDRVPPPCFCLCLLGGLARYLDPPTLCGLWNSGVLAEGLRLLPGTARPCALAASRV